MSESGVKAKFHHLPVAYLLGFKRPVWVKEELAELEEPVQCGWMLGPGR